MPVSAVETGGSAISQPAKVVPAGASCNRTRLKSPSAKAALEIRCAPTVDFTLVVRRGGRRASAGRSLVAPIGFDGTRGGLVIDAMAGGQEVGLEAVVAGGEQGARAENLVAVVHEGDLPHAAQAAVPIGVAVGIEFAEIRGVLLAGGGVERGPRLVRNGADGEGRLEFTGGAGRGLVFHGNRPGEYGGAPEVAVVEEAAAGVGARDVACHRAPRRCRRPRRNRRTRRACRGKRGNGSPCARGGRPPRWSPRCLKPGHGAPGCAGCRSSNGYPARPTADNSVSLSGARANSRGLRKPSRIPGGRTWTREARSVPAYRAGSLREICCAPAMEAPSPTAHTEMKNESHSYR